MFGRKCPGLSIHTRYRYVGLSLFTYLWFIFFSSSSDESEKKAKKKKKKSASRKRKNRRSSSSSSSDSSSSSEKDVKSRQKRKKSAVIEKEAKKGEIWKIFYAISKTYATFWFSCTYGYISTSPHTPYEIRCNRFNQILGKGIAP